MRRMVLVLTTLMMISPVFGLVIDDFEHASLFRWYNTGAPDMAISHFGIDTYSLRINNSDEMFFITYYNPYPTEVGVSDLRFKMYHSPTDVSEQMSILCFMLYDDESSESRIATPETWTFNEWNELSCNGGGEGKLVSIIIYFLNVKGSVFIDDIGFREETQPGLTGMAIAIQNYIPILLPALIIGSVGIFLLRRTFKE